MSARGTSNSNSRGSSHSRRIRKLWLLATFGDGVTAPCSFEGCDRILTFETITADRFPLPGIRGGTYRRGNIRPACSRCNSCDGNDIKAQLRQERANS